MPADLTGIVNEGEFFSQHYLDEILEKDVREVLGGRLAARAVIDAVRGLGREYFRVASDAAGLSHPEKLYRASRDLQVKIAEALGYTYQSGAYVLLEDGAIPVLHEVQRSKAPYVVVIEGRFHTEAEGLLDMRFPAPLPDGAVDAGLKSVEASVSDVVSDLFALEAAPRWVIVVAGGDIVLAERARWGKGRYLRFDLGELLQRGDATALSITAALLCRPTLAPDEGAPVHDTLDEKSHKHAHGVSSELKHAAREAVELIGNEYVHWERESGKKALYSDRLARELTEECLIYLYRLLFLFYAEARAGELHSLPMDREEFALGYSLEMLRELEQVPLATADALNGHFFHESLTRLFTLVNEGHVPFQTEIQSGAERSAEYLNRGFEIDGLNSPLFSPKSTPRLSRTKLRNATLQKVIRLLSLSPEGRRGRGRSAYGRGRISYAQLGINELGAVYEGLLSYTGFFSRETLYEVHKEGEKGTDKTQQAYFVPEKDLARYSEEELTFEDESGQLTRRVYSPGTFIFRLAGRDRETSASYYTPHVLTECLVKYSLRELLQDKTADDILKLTVCEPAMGSGAFLVEAVSQLADAYLERKQEEVGERIDPDRYALEKQRVATHIATHNCYGVDLNPMATRLADVSLWLATMHAGQKAPWFGARLAVGNSLVGARLEVWQASDLETDEALAKSLAKVMKKSGTAPGFEEEIEAVLRLAEKRAPGSVVEVRAIFEKERKALKVASDDDEDGEPDADEPRKGTLKELKRLIAAFKKPRHHRRSRMAVSAADIVAGKRPKGSVYHFLLHDAEMSPFDKDKAIKELAPKEVEQLKKWRKGLTEKYTRSDAVRLGKISDRVDELFTQYVRERERVLLRCASEAPVWGQTQKRLAGGFVPTAKRDKMLTMLQQPSGSYARLKRTMDYWVALWGWPLDQAAKLPSRETWWCDAEALLGVESEAPAEIDDEQLDLLLHEGAGASEPPVSQREKKEAEGAMDVAMSAAATIRPHHWDLEFAEVFVRGGGFDLAVGNPPWIKLQWNEQGVLEDFEPRLALDAVSASEVAKRRKEILGETGRSEYLQSYQAIEGTKAFLGARSNYPLLAGMHSNLYKSFIERAWRIGCHSLVVGLVHQEGFLQEPGGARLRLEFHRRVRCLFRFQNWLRLFGEVMKTRQFCLSVTAQPQGSVNYTTIANLFHPSTIDASYAHDGAGAVPGTKTESGGFEIRGHRDRLVRVGDEELALFAKLYGKPGAPPLEAQLPTVHSREVLRVLSGLAGYRRRLRDLGDEVYGASMFHETYAQTDGTIERRTGVPKRTDEWIVSGPHLYVANPFYKEARSVCRTHRDYDAVDLTTIGRNFLPRSNYFPRVSDEEYDRRTPRFKGKPVTRYYRHVHRRMLGTGERTVTAAVIPPGAAHIHTVVSAAFSDVGELLKFSAFAASLVVDFYVRSKSVGDLTVGTMRLMPVPESSPSSEAAVGRYARLVCCTEHYAELWARAPSGIPQWSSRDARLSTWPDEGRVWSMSTPLRNPFERRQALVELDSLVAIELGLNADELCTIYRSEFAVLRQFEADTWYDSRGNIAFTSNANLGVGLDRQSFDVWCECLALDQPLPDDFDTQNLEPFDDPERPFEVRDREKDMRHAYAFFVKELGLKEPT